MRKKGGAGGARGVELGGAPNIRARFGGKKHVGFLFFFWGAVDFGGAAKTIGLLSGRGSTGGGLWGDGGNLVPFAIR